MANIEISNLDLKVKLTKEYLKNGGIQKIAFPKLCEDLMKVKSDISGKIDPDTVSSDVNAFMLSILGSHLGPPFFHPEYISEYASTLQKSNNFYQENIDTVEHFDKVYEEYEVKTDMLFRGQREAKWRLYNKLQRQWIVEKLSKNEKSYQKLIESLVKIGKAEYGYQIKELLKTYNIDSENPISVLGYLQHHSCPTPLLDWTYKFQNALFFGLDGLDSKLGTVEIENYFSVYFIEEKYFDGSNFRVFLESRLLEVEQSLIPEVIAKIAKDEKAKRDMEEHFAGRKLFDRQKVSGSGLISDLTKIEYLLGFPIVYFSDKDIESGILFSLNNSKNILNQEGVFMLNSDPTKPIEMVGDEYYGVNKADVEEKDYRFCHCFNIHKKLSNYARKRLEADGITKEFIYPTSNINTWEVFEKSKK